jgi:phage terminase large subunit-like protein
VSPGRPDSSKRAELFESFARDVGLHLEPFQRRIVSEVYSPRRELLVVLPRGNGKTTLMAALALWHLLTTRNAEAICAAASREQASLLFGKARTMALSHPELEKRLEVTRRELRSRDGVLKVISADAGKQYGLGPTLALIDELGWHPNHELYVAIRTAMQKRHGKLVTISTPGVSGAEGPLERLRARALSQPSVERSGSLTRAQGPNLALLEWSVAEDGDIDDMSVVKAANPLSTITEADLAEQREAVHELAFRRLHCAQWTEAERYWLPPGAWQSCAAEYVIEEGEPVWLGVDVGGSRAASAVVWLTEDLRLGVEVFQGVEAVLEVVEKVRDLAGRFDVREVRFDPWRFQQAALELQAEGLNTMEFPQSHARMVPASERLYAAVVEGRLKHPNDPDLNSHVSQAIAKDTPRGWRLDKSERSAQIDAVVALAMALEAVEAQPEPAELLGWLGPDGFREAA